MTPTRRLRAGLISGAFATAAEGLWSLVEPRLVGGRKPVFDTTLMASALLHSVSGHRPSSRVARLLGDLMRCVYGPTWALAWNVVEPRRHPAVRSAVILALIIWGAEVVILPSVGATPPLKEWPSVDIVLDLSNAVVYTTAAWAVLALLRRFDA